MYHAGVRIPPSSRLWLGVAWLTVVAAAAAAQPYDRPVEERPELPGYAPEVPEALPMPEESMLPALPPPPLPELRVRVRNYNIHGGTAFTPEELEAVLAPWLGREIDSNDLIAIRDALTGLYVEHGYVNSGAVIPDQDLADGNLEIALVEGTLARIDVSGTERYRPGVLRDRVAVAVKAPLRVKDIEHALQLLQQDPRIERVHARLAPGERAGEAVLSLRVEEANPYRLSLEGSNYAPVAFGSYRGRVILGDQNLLGFGDTLEARFRFSGGLFRFRGDYQVPVTPWGTRLVGRGEYSSSEIIESGFESLDIETTYQAARLGVVHPVYRSERSTLELGLYGDWRRSRTTLLGIGYPFPGSGALEGDSIDDPRRGQTTVSALRLMADFTHRERQQVFAVRSLLSVGLPVLGAVSSGVIPDGEFVAWLGQFQWARRFDFLQLQTLFRTDVQLASDALPTLEQMTVGGHLTVRGYRENQLVRDQGVISSLEVRVPIWRRERPILELAPFVDFGWSKNKNRSTPGPDFLASVGAGLRWSITERIRAQLYYGYQLEDAPGAGGDLQGTSRQEDDLQDHGVQFGVTWDAF